MQMDEMADINAVLNGGREPGMVGNTDEEQEELEAELAALMSEATDKEDAAAKAEKVSGAPPAAPTQPVLSRPPTSATESDARSTSNPKLLA